MKGFSREYPVLGKLSGRLAARRRRVILSGLLRAFAESLALQLPLLVVLAMFSVADPYEPVWLQIMAASFLLHLWPAIVCGHRALRGDFRIGKIAAEMDAANPGAPDVFRTLLSLRNHSPQTLAALERLDAGWEARLRDSSGQAGMRARLAWLGIAACLVLFTPMFFGSPATTWMRMAAPLKVLREQPAPVLAPIGLPARVAVGDSLEFAVRIENVPDSRPVHVHVRSAEGPERRYTMQRHPTSGFGSTATYRLGPVTGDLVVRFSSGRAESPEWRVASVPPPRLQALEVIVMPPEYTRLASDTLPEMPSTLAALPGTKLEWRARPRESLDSLVVSFRDVAGSATRLSLGAGRDFAFSRVVEDPFTLRLTLHADTASGGASATEGPWRVEQTPDMPPEITLLEPAGDGELARSLRVPIRFRAIDDFGVSVVRLHYTVRDGGSLLRAGSVDLTDWLDRRDGHGAGIWDASATRAEAGDVVEVFLEVEDTDVISGPKATRSALARLRLPTSEEVLVAVDAGKRDAAVSLASALEREERIRREVRSPDQGSRGEDPFRAWNEWEVRRVLSDQPRQHLREVARQLGDEISHAPDARRRDALEDARREAEAMQERVPDPGITHAGVDEKAKALDDLRRDQEALQQMLEQAPPPVSAPVARSGDESSRQPSPRMPGEAERLQAGREQLRESLERHREEQRQLGEWLAEQARGEADRRRREERAEQHAAQLERDVREAMEQMEEVLRKAMDDGTLGSDVVEKMDRIRELLAEVLDAGEQERLRSEAGDHAPDAGEMRDALREMLEQGDGLRQSLERAVRMLENLRDVRALAGMAEELRELEAAQRELAAGLDAAHGADAEALAGRQEALQQQLERVLEKMENLEATARFRPPERKHAEDALQAMQETAEGLRKQPQDRAPSQAGADLAARRLEQAAAEMEKLLMQLDAAANMAEVRATLEETLEFTRWLAEARISGSFVESQWGGREGVQRSAVNTARWLRQRMLGLADVATFESEMLRREAAWLGAHADELAAGVPTGTLDGLHRHAQGASRELLKWLNQANDGNGSEEGEGAGDSDLGGGETGDSGQEGIAGRVRGLSGRQMSVNRATQELLRSFMQERQGRGDPSQSTMPGGMPGAGDPSQEGSGERDGGTGGFSEGNGSEGDGEGPSDAAGAAAGQQSIAEALEHLAEAADDAGGAARRLRQLAEEARALEEELRRRRLDPGEIERRQERFRTRLLEAANALEERGRQRERRAETHATGLIMEDPPASGVSDQFSRELRARRERALALPLTPEQRRRVEWYYEQLLGR